MRADWEGVSWEFTFSISQFSPNINMSEKTIGSLNGKWSWLFLAQLAVEAACFPFVILFAIWVTQKLNSLDVQAAVHETEIKHNLEHINEIKTGLQELKRGLKINTSATINSQR